MIGAVACMAIFAGDRLIVGPLQTLWKDRTARIGELEKSLDRGQTLLTRESALQERWAEMQKRCLPTEIAAAENQALKSVDDWARQSRLGLTSLKPRWTKDEEDYKKVEFQAGAQGTMEAISRFLYMLEKSPLALRVEDVEIASRDGKGDNLTLTLRFSGLLSIEKKPKTSKKGG